MSCRTLRLNDGSEFIVRLTAGAQLSERDIAALTELAEVAKEMAAQQTAGPSAEFSRFRSGRQRARRDGLTAASHELVRDSSE